MVQGRLSTSPEVCPATVVEKKTRTETDSFGAIEVPSDRYWGAQTQRSKENFDIGGERFPRVFIRAYGIVKQAAIEIIAQEGGIPERFVAPIIAATQEVI